MLSPSSCHHTVERFSELLRARLQGDFQTDSPAYRLSCTFAANPIIVEQKLLRYTFTYGNLMHNPFRMGCQAVVTTDNHGFYGHGHALFALVRKVVDEITMSSWPENKVEVLVEVHTIPGFHINWHCTLLWPYTPFHTIFIQPHIFWEEYYTPLSILIIRRDVPIIHFSLIDLERYQQSAPYLQLPVLALPSLLVYPQQSAVPSLDLAVDEVENVDLVLNEDMIDEILDITDRNWNAPPSPTIVPDEPSAVEEEFSESDAGLSETEYGSDETQ
jgi:hypothetical protein